MSSNPRRTTAAPAPILLLPLLLLLPRLILSIQIVVDSGEPNGEKNSETVQWQILTKVNYSSEIRRHPHLLLLVTVPWCGESRSLVKELANVVANKQERYGMLKLMLLYRNTESMLANALGATDGITILYFHHSMPYKYGGRLRIQNILSSIQHVMSLLPEEHPLKPINTPEELTNFLDSTDKALLLLEFCGWTPKLLARGKNNITENAFGVSEETSGTLLEDEKRKQKWAIKHYKSCNADNGQIGFPWLSESTSVNDSFLLESQNMTPRGGLSCALDDLQRLESFLPKFINVAREFFLPPERIRFGLVSQRSLLSKLNIEASDSWFVTLYSSGCPSCSKVVTEGDDLKTILDSQESIVTELGDDVNDLRPALPSNKPSILLFIHRSSGMLKIRRESKDALDAFRELALHYQTSNKTYRQKSVQLHETYQASTTSKHPRLERFPASQKLNLEDKTSIMILNEGKHITVENFASDIQGSSLHEILAYLLQQKKELKLSSLAKEAGFQLLSEDFEIKAGEALSSQPEQQSDHTDGILKGTVDSDDEQKLQRPGTLNSGNDGDSKVTDAECFQQVDGKDPTDLSGQLSAKSHSKGVAYAENSKLEEETLPGVGPKNQPKGFSGSFFFCDGHFRFLKALTAGLHIPSVVIIDPTVQQHFILTEAANFSYSLLSDFLDGFLNKSLSPYQQSEPFVQSPRDAPVPPFVNLDFHETDSIPRVTTHSFAELVLGNQSDTETAGNAWDRDVLVLFSNNWCGFCQRMELVVREVYRAIKGYAMMSRKQWKSKNFLLRNDNMKSSNMKVPLIYLMDCTLNDCRLILKAVIKRELFPSLLLFRARNKNAITYEGDSMVSGIMKFLSDHGSLAREKGTLWSEVERRGSFPNSAPLSQIARHEVLLKDRTQNMPEENNKIRVSSLIGLYKTTPLVVAGCILTATDKLLNVQPFDESKILIVKVDQEAGFEGLIVNKHISWDSLEELEEGLKLLKEAPLSYGGPVVKRGMPLVALSHKSEKDQYIEVLPSVYFFDELATIDLIEELRLGNKSIYGYWFFIGFSSWSLDQLFQEIAEGAWNVGKGNIEQLDWPQVH